jgi:hypothetical protein
MGDKNRMTTGKRQIVVVSGKGFANDVDISEIDLLSVFGYN